MPQKPTLHQDTHLKVSNLLSAKPHMNQRNLAAALGVGLGKTNFCVKALLNKGLLKVKNFQNSKRKLAYAGILTLAGIVTKSELTVQFLKHKLQEYKLHSGYLSSAHRIKIFKNGGSDQRCESNDVLSMMDIKSASSACSISVCSYY
jgi:EPS-associated MarR family transcriptional regulator